MIKKETTNNKVQSKEKQIKTCLQFVYIFMEFSKAETSSFKSIHHTADHGQNRVGNGDSVGIQSVVR